MLERGLGSNWQAHKYWIYNTSYDDWYFGLRRLFAEGSRPDVVAITLAAMHWYKLGIRGDYSSAYMFQPGDIREIRGELGLDRTTASNLLFARYSRFYALRGEIRKVLLQHLLPDLPNMYALFKPTMTRHMAGEQVLAIVRPRIKKIRQVVESNGATLILIVPPVPQPGGEYQQELRAAAHEAGVEAFIPMSYTDVPSNDFLDDIHLTPEGAELYTSKLVDVLRPALDASVAGRQK